MSAPSGGKPLGLTELADFIAAFNESTSRLQESHDRLRARAEELAGELSEKNRELSARVEEVSGLKNYLSNILGSIGDGVLALDAAGALKALNHEGESLLAACGLALADCSRDRASPGGKIAQLLLDSRDRGAEVKNAEIVCELPGGLRVLDVSAAPLRDSGGAVIGAVATFRDNTELRRLEKQLIRRERLAALGEMASQLAHEIRNPLGGIALYASLLKRSLADRPKDAELSGKIGSATAALNRLVEDMLTLARQAEPCREPVRVGGLLDSALELAAASAPIDCASAASGADAEGLAGSVAGSYGANNCGANGSGSGTNGNGSGAKGKVRVSRQYARDCVFPLDQNLMQRAFLNVIQNAFQFMDGGGELTLKAANTPGGGLTVEIADTGPGIPESIREQVFNPFFTRRENGTGLGLAIVNKIIQDHGATVSIRDNVPSGAVFVFEFTAP